MLLSLGWWNTSLSPTRGAGSSVSRRNFAIGVISDLLDSGLQLLGLCEVSLDDVKAIEHEFGSRGFGVLYALDPIGRTRFDMALIYRLSTTSCLARPPWTSSFGKRNFRISYPVDVTFQGKNILLVLAHWPSRLYYPKGDAQRHRIAIDMRSRLDQLFFENEKDVIVMGDFNDEPFDQNLAAMLLALRDRTSAAQKRSHFYNPFWNFLGSRPSHEGPSTGPSYAGTYRYAKDETEVWWTFDQMLFSSSFVSDVSGDWHLDEQATSVVFHPRLVKKMTGRGKFDHLPIVCAIKRAS